MNNDILIVETVKFRRPSSNKTEVGLRVSDNSDRAIIIDKDLNPIVHASYEGYFDDTAYYNLNV